MQWSGASKSFNEWKSQVDGGASDQLVVYNDPDRNPGSYNAGIGGTGTISAYLVGARQQGRDTWRNEYATDQVVSYIREGFGLFCLRPQHVRLPLGPLSEPSKQAVREAMVHAGLLNA